MRDKQQYSSRFYSSANGKGRSRVSFSLKELEPPADAAAERAIISTLYANPRETYEKLKNSIKTEDFYVEEHRELYKYFFEFVDEHSIEQMDNVSISYFLRKKNKYHLYEYLVSILDEATAEKVLEIAIKSVKEKAFLRKAIEREAEILFEIKESEDVYKLKELYQQAIEEIEEIEHVKDKEEDESLIKRLSLTAEDLEAQQVEYLVSDFIPRGSLILMTARFGGGKSLSALAVAKYLIRQQNSRVLYLDLDNSLHVIGDRIKKAGLADELGNRLLYISRSAHYVSARSALWQRLKNELRESEHLFIIVDTLKNFARGSELNSDKEMTEVMSELLDLRDAGHTVLVLHHLAKRADDDYKNSTTIADSVDVAYRLYKDKSKLIFEVFKDRIPVKSQTFEIDSQLNLKPALPPGLEEERIIVEAIYKRIPPEGKKQSDLIPVVCDYLKAHYDFPAGRDRVTSILQKYEGCYWEVVRAERNMKIYKRVEGADPAIQFPKNLPYIYSPGNSETQGAQGLEGYQTHEIDQETRKLNGDKGSSDPEGGKELNNNDESDEGGDDWDDVELDF